MFNKNPLVSIVTVVFNGETVLEKTIQSIVSQSYQNIQYIIIDGASKDNTLSIIKKYETRISYWISEPDKGIYDAMNKGLAAATGEYVWFMNAGDSIYSASTLEQIIKKHGNSGDAYYGETQVVGEQGSTIGMRRLSVPEKLTWKNLKMGMVVCHQSIIIKKEYTSPYNLNYPASADIDWIIHALKKSNTIINTHLIITNFLSGGSSSKNIIQSNIERFKIMVYYYGWISTLLNHFIIGVKFTWFYLRHRRI